MVNIKLGDTLIAFSSQDNEFLEKAGADYQEFLVTGDPDFCIDFTLDLNMTPAKVKKIIRYANSRVDGNRYYTEPELIDCKLNWENHYLSVHTQRAIFQGEVNYQLMSYLMRGIYAGVVKKSRKMPIDKYIVHGCGVTQDDKYFLFTGVSGSGKTTVAKLAGSRIVLNDEAVLMNCRDNVINISGSPLGGELPLKSKIEGPLTVIYFLQHASEVKLERLSPSQAYALFLCQVFDMSPLFEVSTTETLQERADFSLKVVQLVPCFRLGFRRDNSFWEVVENAVSVSC